MFKASRGPAAATRLAGGGPHPFLRAYARSYMLSPLTRLVEKQRHGPPPDGTTVHIVLIRGWLRNQASHSLRQADPNQHNRDDDASQDGEQLGEGDCLDRPPVKLVQPRLVTFGVLLENLGNAERRNPLLGR